MECYGFFVFYIVILPPHAASESDNPPQPIDTAKQIVLAQTGQTTELQKYFFYLYIPGNLLLFRQGTYC